MDLDRSVSTEQASEPPLSLSGRLHLFTARFERWADAIFIWPAVTVILLLSIFPLIVSLYLSLSRLQLVRGGFEVTFVGLLNYRKLLLGGEQSHFLGVFAAPSPLGWLLFGGCVALMILALLRYVRGTTVSLAGFFWRCVAALGFGLIAWLMVTTLFSAGRPGTLVVTLVYVLVGVIIQFGMGLGLALLCIQRLPGRRFFRVVFLLPMMITPVGVAYMFRMLTDTSKGPFRPAWEALGLLDFSWVATPWGARIAILIGDIWQWTPFMFIVLLAALEAQSIDPVEAALVDGASNWQIFRHITWPAIFPVSTTIILIRMIEAFKIVDLPNVLTSGGPGTATESATLHAYIAWRTLDLGGSAAVAYMLLILVTFVCISLVQFIRRQGTERA
jgi:multiple sugar transport system permease protein